jgi:hypothetical protein
MGTGLLRGERGKRRGRYHGRSGGSDQALDLYRDCRATRVGHLRHRASRGYPKGECRVKGGLSSTSAEGSLPSLVSLTGAATLRVSPRPVGSCAKHCRSNTDTSPSDCSSGCRRNSTSDPRLTEGGTSSRRCWPARSPGTGSRSARCSWARARKGSTLSQSTRATRTAGRSRRGREFVRQGIMCRQDGPVGGVYNCIRWCWVVYARG